MGNGAPSPLVLPAAERGSRKSARAPLGAGERGDLGRRVNLSESRLLGLRNGDDDGVPFRKRSLRRRFYLPRRTVLFFFFPHSADNGFRRRNGMDK